MAPVPAPFSAAHPGESRIRALEGLRGLLALWVTVSHVICLCGLDESVPAYVRKSFWQWLAYAGPAVDVFIILSGFAIFKMLRNSSYSYGPFLLNRTFRIFPVYLTCLALAFMTSGLSQSLYATAPWHLTAYFQRAPAGLGAALAHWPAQLGCQRTLFQGLAPSTWPPPDGIVDFLPPAWSATLEWQFYLIAPALVPLCSGRAGSWLLAALLAFALCGSLLLSSAGFTYGGFLGLKLWLFLLGMASGLLHERLPYTTRFQRRLMGSAALVGAVIITLTLHNPDAMLWVIVFAGVTTKDNRAAGLSRTVLTYGPLLWIGRISYSLYLVHWPLLTIGIWLLLQSHPAVSSPVAAAWLFCVGMPAIIGLAGGLHAWVEAPLMRLGRRFVARSDSLRPAPASP